MTLHHPESLEAALTLMAKRAGVPLAGGTDIYPSLRDGPPPRAMIDVTGIAGLRGIAREGGYWRIGAATTWSDILRADLPSAFDALRMAAREVGSVQIQNTGTIAGNLCNASPAADGVPPLLVLDAIIELAGPSGIRRLALQEFILGPRRTALRPDELVTAVLVPDRPARSSFVKLGSRRYLVISIAMVAALVEMDGPVIGRAAVAVGSCSPVALRLPALEAALVGRTAEEIGSIVADAPLDGLAPLDDVRASAGYRLEAVRELVARAIRAAMEPPHVA